MTVLKTLIKARELISDKQHWCRFTMAIDKHGAAVDLDSTQACSWCATGAILRGAPSSCREELAALQALAESATVNRFAHDNVATVQYVNDIRGHEAILQLFDLAIAEEKRK